jgi:plasmid maintenance system antidote protein VapI
MTALDRKMKENNIRTGVLAKAVEVTPSCISRLRKGHPASKDVAKKISDAIGISVLALLYPEAEERQEAIVDKTADVSL